ncbi:CrpP-related protein [Achromobacter ruhlandii]|uniref:CrpP-related protein n=1 Tax=Achromobacter ruhlandii TaxID=72557 RepID=UPI002649537A|nr:CrpP-related protein [Achromobacter ruhlandii]
MRKDAFHLGVKAAIEGLDLFSCPYFKATAMPRHSGMPISEWREHVESWEAGWHYAMAARFERDHEYQKILDGLQSVH